jgi:hypothetical protein
MDITNLSKQQRLDPTVQSTFNADEELQRAGAPNYKRVIRRHVLQYMSRLDHQGKQDFVASLPIIKKKPGKPAYVKKRQHTLPDIHEVSVCKE